MKTKSTLLFLFILLNMNVFAQDDFQMWVKLSPEIRLNIKNTIFEFRWRPDDHIFINEDLNIARTDVMLGVNVGKFKIFSYSKFDNLERSWTGARVDFNTSFLDKKLLVNIQTRYFFGLNEKSAEHYYLVQFIRYKLNSKIRAGILSYGKWASEKAFNQGYWFVGASANFILPYHFNLHIALTKDIFHKEIYMTFVRLGYKFKL